MPFRAYNLRMGSYTFIVPDTQGAHTVQDQKLGPSGPVDFTFKNTDGGGLLGVEDGVEFQPNKYLSARGADCAFPGQVIIQPQATTVSVGSGQPALGYPLKSVDFTESSVTRHYLVGSNNTIFRTNSDTPPVWVAVGSLGGEPATDILVYSGAVGVAHGTGFRYSTDGTTWTADTDDADILGALGNTLYRVDRPNTIYAGTGASFGTAWDSGSSVADTSYNINSLLGIESVLLIGKEDGVYSIDETGTVVPFTPELRFIANAVFASAARVAAFNGDYYFATQYGIIQVSGVDGSKRRVGFDQLTSPDIPTPQVRALASDDRYLYALVQNTSTDLMILRRDAVGRWNVFYWDGTSGTKQGQHIAVTGTFGYPALLFSYFDNASTFTTRLIRLASTPNPDQDSNYRYDITGGQNYWVRLGRFGPLDSNIVIDRCTILSENLASGVTITPYLSNEGAAAAQFGTSGAISSPYTDIVPTAAVEGRYFDAYAYFVTNDATVGPLMKSLSFRGWLQPQMRRVHTFLVAASGSYSTPKGDYLIQSPVEVITNLQTLRTDSAGYITIIDENGREWSGIVASVERNSTEGLNKVDGTAEHIVRVTVVEAIGVTTVPVQVYEQARYS